MLVVCFLALWAGQSVAGYFHFLEEQESHGAPRISFISYLASDSFWEATAENWESEFLQIFMYVALTAFLYQKGSAESKNPDSPDEPPPPVTADSPWPVRKGGWVLRLYEHSLSIAFFLFFLLSFWIHALSGAGAYNEEQRLHGEQEVSTVEYMQNSQFWFESFQNWQSEFLAIAAMVLFTIFLREKSSPESKPVQMPHHQNPD